MQPDATTKARIKIMFFILIKLKNRGNFTKDNMQDLRVLHPFSLKAGNVPGLFVIFDRKLAARDFLHCAALENDFKSMHFKKKDGGFRGYPMSTGRD